LMAFGSEWYSTDYLKHVIEVAEILGFPQFLAPQHMAPAERDMCAAAPMIQKPLSSSTHDRRG